MRFENLIPWNAKDSTEAGHPYMSLRGDFDRLFDDFFGGGLMPPAAGFVTRGFTPRINVEDGKEDIVVSAELPGVDEKDIDVSLVGDLLIVRGEKKYEREDNHDGYVHSERVYGSFQRTVALPAEVKGDKVEAGFKKGVLTIRLPKTEVAQSQARKITVKSE